jgi:hypothetical protein
MKLILKGLFIYFLLLLNSCSKNLDLNDFIGVYDATVVYKKAFIKSTKITIDKQNNQFTLYCPENNYIKTIPIQSNGEKTFTINYEDRDKIYKYIGTGALSNDYTITIEYEESISSNPGWSNNYRIIATR